MQEKITPPIKVEPKKRKPKQIQPNIENDIKLLLSSTSILISSKLDKEIWLITDEEITMISKPLSNIIKKLDPSLQTSKYIDYISLITALAIVILPRLILQLNKNKEKKNEESLDRSNKSDNKPASTTPAQYSKDLYPNI